MGPKANKKNDDVNSSKSKATTKKRPPPVDTASQGKQSKKEAPIERAKSQTSQRYEEEKAKEQVVADQLESPHVEEAPADEKAPADEETPSNEEAPVDEENEEQHVGEISPDANENIEDEDDGLDLQPLTTKGAHLQSELDGQLNSITRTQKNLVNDEDALILEEAVNDHNTDYNQVKDEKSVVNDDLGILEDEEDIQPVQKDDSLTQEQIQTIVESWDELLKKGEVNVGKVLFKNIFQIAPQALQLFSFKDSENLFSDQRLLDHGVAVVRTIGTTVAGLQNIQDLVPVLIDLGEIHAKKGVLPEHYPVVAQALQNTLKAALKQKYTKEVIIAWDNVYNIISRTMQYEWYTNPDLIGDELTPKRIELVQQTWSICKDLGYEAVGDQLFINIFEAAPQALQLFSFGAHSDYRSTDQYKDHVVKVASTLSTAVENLQNLDELVPFLKNLGADHVPRGVIKEHYPIVMNALLKTLKDNLGTEFTPAVKKAWQVITNVVSETMISDNYDQQTLSNEIDVEEIPRDPVEQVEQETIRTLRNEDTMRPMIEQEENNLEIDDLVKGFKNAGKSTKEELIQNQTYIKMVFTKEVDFHHKIAYRFEKAYRLGKKSEQKKDALNYEIIDCISQHSLYIEQDPMALFYCLFFCIYFKNEELVEFLRSLITKINTHNKIDRLLEIIDTDGIDKIRSTGEQINQIVYHMVFYQAIDDNLRVVYAQILRQLRLLQMRDKDALHLLNTRDYELIRQTFTKHTTKIDIKQFYKETFSIKASTYRRYNQAYYEEIVITSGNVEERVAQNYRERFLVTVDDIYIVFEMYCKEDYDTEFIQTRKDEITHQQFIDLFIICVRNDSFRIGMLIYTMYLNTTVDMDKKMMDIVMQIIKDTTLYHETKLFLVHEHFDILSIEQMNNLVDIYQDIVHSKDPKDNPLISQYNVIKVALLIFRICWKIERKKIYSLITKCQLLQIYLIKALCRFFERQKNILVLYKFMSEPILHMTERKDSLDMMYEMNMQQLLQHPVVVEVLNFVYEGKYSVSSSSLSMSQTFQCTLEMETMSLKSINERLIQNVVKLGDTGSQKQTSLQYNIWKQSIQQRQQDEMVFTTIVSFFLIYKGIFINLSLNQTFNHSKFYFGEDFGRNQILLINAETDVLYHICHEIVPDYQELYDGLYMLYVVTFILTIGMFASSCQKIIVYKTKDNVTLAWGQIFLEITITAAGFLFLLTFMSKITNTLVGDLCGQQMDIANVDIINKIFSLLNPQEGELDLKLIISTLIIQLCIMSIIMLQRTQYLGELIMMLDQMKNELVRFFLTFGLIILIFLLLGRFLSSEFKFEPVTLFDSFIDLFNALNGNINFDSFTHPIGQTYIAFFMFLFKVLFMSLLAAMFINRYQTVWVNLDAYRRFTIIKLKNSISYDKFIGGVTLTFFPINIIMLPFAIMITIMRSKRASDILLKVQYSIMMLFYCIISAIMFLPATFILLVKLYANSIFIYINNKREAYRGENVVQLIKTFVLGPILIFLSIIVDLFSLPNTLLKDGANFEHKYQLSQDRLNDDQIKVVMTTFTKIFYGQNWQGFKGGSMTLMELMLMHTGIFKLIDNLHDLLCRGNKDYKEALSNVQDYNMTKILTRMASIPALSGDYKEGYCDLNTIHAVQMDIELYNYVDVVLRKVRMGILKDEIYNKERGTFVDNAEKSEGGAEEALDEDDDELKKVEGVLSILIGPDGAPLKRNNSDVMNNFFVNYAVRTFTNIEKLIKNTNTSDARKDKKFLAHVDKKQQQWKRNTIDQFTKSTMKYEKFINKQLGLQTQDTIDSKKEEKTQSTHSSNVAKEIKNQKTI